MSKTVEELAADKDFNPDTTGMPLFDSKPFGWTDTKRQTIRQRTACQVPGCGVPYAPGGCCGYCRQKVRNLRLAQTGRATRKRVAS